MQAMHFAFGIGAFIAPLLSQPFLSDMPILSVTSTDVPANFMNPLNALHNDSILSRHVRDSDSFLSHQFMDHQSILSRHVRDADNSNSTTDLQNLTTSHTVGESNVTVNNLSSTTTQPPTTKAKEAKVVIKKPTHSDSGDFDKSNADGAKIKEHLNKAQKDGAPESSGKAPVQNTKTEKETEVKKEHQTRVISSNVTSENASIEDVNSTVADGNVSTTLVTPSTAVELSSVTSSGVAGGTKMLSTSASTSTKMVVTKTEQPTTTKTIVKTTATDTPSSTQQAVSTQTEKSTTKEPTPSSTIQLTTQKASTTATTQKLAPAVTDKPVPSSTAQPTTTTSPSAKTKSTVKTTKQPVVALTTKAKEAPPGDKDNKGKQSSISVHTSTASINETVSETEGLTTETNIRKPGHSISGIITNAVDAVKNMSRIQFAYLIIGALLLLNSVLFLILYCYDRHRSDYSSLLQSKDPQDRQEVLCCRIVILVLMFFFFLAYIGMETTFGGLLMTFAVSEIHWSKDQGAIVTAIFWGSLAAGRGFSIFIANCCKPPTMLIIDLILLIIGALMLSFGLKFEFVVWLGTLAVGFGMSSIFPTSISWMEQYYRMTGKSIAVLVMGSALGQMIVPVVTGYFYQHIEPMSLMYSLLVLSVFMLALYILMQLVASRAGRGGTLSQNGFMHLRDDDNLELDDINYGTTTQDSTRRRFMPTFSDEAEYNKLLQDEEDDIDLLG